MEIDAIHAVVASIHPETYRSILYSPSSLRCLLSLPRRPLVLLPNTQDTFWESPNLRRLAFAREMS
jgi:hypothetical protein